jgi:acetoin utilization protein AcuB
MRVTARRAQLGTTRANRLVMSHSIARVGEFMTASPLSITRDRSLADAEQLMKTHGVRHLPVLDDDGALVGVLSAREVNAICRLRDVDPTRVVVDHAASHRVFTVPPESPLDDVCATMAQQRFGCAVVVQAERVVGIFTSTDACATLAGVLRTGAAR